MRFFKSLAGKITIGVVLAGGITALVIYYIYFKKTYEHLKAVPDTTYFVATMNPMGLHDKMNWSEFTELEMMKEIRKGMPDVIGKVYDDFIDDPMSLGIALKNDIYFFVYKKGTKDIIGLSMSIHKRSSFEDVLSTFGVNSSIKEGDGYKYIYPQEDAFVGWDKSTLLVVYAPDGAEGGEMEQEYKRLMSLDEKEQLQNSDKDFEEFINGEQDFKMWACTNPWAEIVAYEANKSSAGMVSVTEEEVKDNRLHWTINFEKGQIIMEQEVIPNAKIKELNLVEQIQKTVDKKLFELIPGKNLLAAMSYGVNIPAMIESASAYFPPALSQMMAQAPKELGISHKDMMEVIKGDVVFAFYGVIPVEKQRASDELAMSEFFDDEDMAEFAEEIEQIKEELDSQKMETYTAYVPDIVIAFTVNQETMKKLIDIAIAQMPEEVKASGEVAFELIEEKYYKISTIQTMYLGFNNDIGYITTNEEFIKQAVDGNFKQEQAISQEIMEYIGTSFAGGYINLQMETYPQPVMDMLDEEIGTFQVVSLQKVTELFKDAVFKAGGYKATWGLHLTKSENYALFEIFNKINEVQYKN